MVGRAVGGVGLGLGGQEVRGMVLDTGEEGKGVSIDGGNMQGREGGGMVPAGAEATAKGGGPPGLEPTGGRPTV